MGQVVNNVAQFCVEPEGIMMEFLPSKLQDFIWENNISIRSDELDAGVDDVIYVPYLNIDLEAQATIDYLVWRDIKSEGLTIDQLNDYLTSEYLADDFDMLFSYLDEYTKIKMKDCISNYNEVYKEIVTQAKALGYKG